MSDKIRIEIADRKANPLMKREEVTVSLDHRGRATPSRLDMIKEVASKLKAKEDLLVIDRIITLKGDSRSAVKVLSYKKREDIPKGKLEKMSARLEKVRKKAGGKEKEPVKESKKSAKETEPAEEEKKVVEGEE